MLGYNTGSVRLRRVGRFTHANQDHPTVPSIGSTGSTAKATTDELRKEDGTFYTYGTQIEREKQLIDKRRKLDQQLEEEQVYAQLWALDAKKKHEREI